MNEFVALRTFQVDTALVYLQFCIGVEAIHTKKTWEGEWSGRKTDEARAARDVRKSELGWSACVCVVTLCSPHESRKAAAAAGRVTSDGPLPLFFCSVCHRAGYPRPI